MNWMVEGTSHAVIVEKSCQRLSVWKIENGEPRMIESCRCSTGKNVGDKWVRGDMRTPEGVYFFCSLISGTTLPPRYGPWAFTTDYPNFIDQRRGKGGDGIWLHGRDKPLGPAPDSNGCIALENSDLIKVSKFIRLQSTPLIIVKKIRMAPRSLIMEQERELRDFIESWRQAWASQDLERYMSHYSRNFQSCRLDYTGWKEKKRMLNERYAEIEVRLGNINLYRQGQVVTAIGEQTYASERFRAEGIKILYITRDGACRVYSEDYREAIDDPVPVKLLLARVDRNVSRGSHKKREFRIKLVSTDGRDLRRREEIEVPRPVAPSRGVVLDRIATRGSKGVPVLALLSNKKRPGHARHGRLTVDQAIGPRPRLCEKAVLCGLQRNQAPRMSVESPISADRTETGTEPVGSRDRVRLKERPATVLNRRDIWFPASGREAARVSGDSFAVENAWDNASFTSFQEHGKSSWEENGRDSQIRVHRSVFPGGAVTRTELNSAREVSFKQYLERSEWKRMSEKSGGSRELSGESP